MGFLSDRSVTADTTGGYIHIILPNAGAPTGFDSYRISVTNLQADLNALITALDGRVTVNEDDIADLQEILTRDRLLSATGSGNRTLPANGVLTAVNITVVSGSSVTVQVGTTPGGSDLVDYSGSKTLAANDYKRYDLVHRNTVSGGNSASQSIYWTVTGGTVHFHFNYEILSTT